MESESSTHEDLEDLEGVSSSLDGNVPGEPALDSSAASAGETDAVQAGTDAAQAETDPGQAGERASRPTATSERPREPALPEFEDTEEGKRASADVLRRLLDFHLQIGPAPDRPDSPVRPRPVPALLSTYLDLSRLRYDYPVCLIQIGGPSPVRSLTEIIDALIEKHASDDDEGRSLERHLHQLEAKIKEAFEGSSNASVSTERVTLKEAWDRAFDALMANPTLTLERQEKLSGHLIPVREELDFDGVLLPCGAEAVREIFRYSVSDRWARRTGDWKAEVERLIQELRNILLADASHSPDAMSADRLRASSGDVDDLDPEAMSSILSASDLGEPMPAGRRDRIEATLETLERVAVIFGRPLIAPGGSGAAPFPTSPVVGECRQAQTRCAELLRVMADFFKSVAIARLEVENRYREELHGPFYRNYGPDQLSEEELRYVPPVLLVIEGSMLDSKPGMLGELLTLLSGNHPVKILVLPTNLVTGGTDSGDSAIATGWQGRLANMALGLDRNFVFQSPASDLESLRSGFERGSDTLGPALFSVHAGDSGETGALGAYHLTAAATESRLLPVFAFDPTRGNAWSERMEVGGNPQAEKDWPVEPFRYQKANGEEAEIELAFTAADFLYCQEELAHHFWEVPSAEWHPNMVPAHTYEPTDGPAGEAKIPYLTIVDSGGNLGRAVPTHAVVSFVESCLCSWRTFRELGGIENSHALALLQKERERLEEEKRGEVAEIERKYSVRLDQDVGELTKVIVDRIAGQLLAGGDGGGAASVSWTQMSSAEPAAPGPAAAEAETQATGDGGSGEDEDEEVAVVIEDPYIDTPLCTTCNECTNLNGQMFAYDQNKQAYIKDPVAGTYRDLVLAAEKCPVHIIHPGKPLNEDEPGLEELIQRASPFN